MLSNLCWNKSYYFVGMIDYKFSVFVDCGAPSLYNRLSRKTGTDANVMGTHFKHRKYDTFSYVDLPEYIEYRDKYVQFLKEHKKSINIFSNLDVINNPTLTLKNQKIIESKDVFPIPVFHLGSDVSYLREYVKNYEYIAIGGLVPNPTSVLIPALDRLWREELIDEKGFPKVKVHGFACTSFPLMYRYPWYSVDSATCLKLGMYGKIYLPEYRSMRLNMLAVSSRDIKVDDRVTKGVQRELNRRAEKWNTDLTCLSENITERAIWNYLVFLEQIQTYIPNWPWSLFNRRTKNTSTGEKLNFYLAGNFSKKEEKVLCEKLEEQAIPENQRFRLLSFWYREYTAYRLNLRNETIVRRNSRKRKNNT